jgi:hypothetical protein
VGLRAGASVREISILKQKQKRLDAVVRQPGWWRQSFILRRSPVVEVVG